MLANERTVLHELVAGHSQTMLAELRDADPTDAGCWSGRCRLTLQRLLEVLELLGFLDRAGLTC